jgi:hypothetical protein
MHSKHSCRLPKSPTAPDEQFQRVASRDSLPSGRKSCAGWEMLSKLHLPLTCCLPHILGGDVGPRALSPSVFPPLEEKQRSDVFQEKYQYLQGI